MPYPSSDTMAAIAHDFDAQQRSPEIVADHDQEKHIGAGGQAVLEFDSDKASDVNKQDGVKNVEAVTVSWDRKMLWLTFVL